MKNQPHSPPYPDFSSEWIDTSSRVRSLSQDLSSRTVGTHLAKDTARLAEDISKLCDHVEQLHRSVGTMLEESAADEGIHFGEVSPELKTDQAQREAVKIHRESHEMRPDIKDIIKALFMWQDDPVERSKQSD